MVEIQSHTIFTHQSVTDALVQMEKLGKHLTLFVVDETGILKGTLTDGDIRRGLLKNLQLADPVSLFMEKNFRYLTENAFSMHEVSGIRNSGVILLPIVDRSFKIIKIVNLAITKTILPLDVVVMAGGEGRRLLPMTEATPKPLLKVGDKPIIEHNLDRLISYGVSNFWISIRYLGEQIEQYFGDGFSKHVSIGYIWENEALGTIGAVSKIEKFKHEHLLVTNSDLLTNLDYEDFYTDFVKNGADFSVATVPYVVSVPYAVLETSNGQVVSFKEKPSYTYFSNAGIYLMKKECCDLIPKGFFNATDLMEELIKQGKKVISYPIMGYWMDIGNPQDYAKANADINHLKL